jgi:alkylhydroperoxidase family enzyme
VLSVESRYVKEHRAPPGRTIKCSKNPQGLLDSDMAKLYGHGLTTSQVVELIAMSAFAVYANIIADATAMDPDDMFSRI